MGFLDKLLRRRKSEAGQGMKTAPSPDAAVIAIPMRLPEIVDDTFPDAAG